MSYRKRENRHDQWLRYCKSKSEAISEFGLPTKLFSTEQNVEDFLVRGIASTDSEEVQMLAMSDEAFLRLMKFVDGWWDNFDGHLTTFYKERLRRFGRYG